MQECWSRVTGGLSKYYASDIVNKGCVSARLVSLRLAAVGKRFLGVLGDNLDDLNHGVRDKDGGEGLEGVVGIVDGHVDLEELACALAQLAPDPSKRTFLWFNMIILDSREDEHKLCGGLSLLSLSKGM